MRPMDDLLKAILSGAVLAALLAGLFRMWENYRIRRHAKDALLHGFAAEIGVGLANIPENPSDEEVSFLASDGLPYEFYSSNKDKIGIIGAKAEYVIEYYTLRWQFYRGGEMLNKARAALDDCIKNMADVAKKQADVDAAKTRLQGLLTATQRSASVAVDALHGHTFWETLKSSLSVRKS